ncbi:hypothetical protein [Methylobacterium brachythecii]|uniref:Uncharacterized protein n=1 Tax=Methylobacterium brachythecii TaxID=1176177 RepID=A0A7W6AKI3_9HYPH|nr:hypothetical protein [Methylobacterium brachythecii]MBB3905127.1 hypothetical protein [Methylobacterium brachythecii]GLS44365.1 hypothetical protein GCM10007884_23530 [Methylobacterium brachythecii]
MTKQGMPSAQAPIAVGNGNLSPEWFKFFLFLFTALQALDERITALENAP